MDALGWYEQAIKTAAKMGADGSGGYMGALSMQDFKDEGRKDYLMKFLIEAFQYLSQVAKEAGQKFFALGTYAFEERTSLHYRGGKAASSNGK